MVDESSLNTMNKLVFRVFMSTLLFLNVYNIGDLSKLSINNLKLLGYAFIIIFVIVFLAWLIYMPKVKENKKIICFNSRGIQRELCFIWSSYCR